MERPKIEDFKVEYIRGYAEIASIRKQYSRAQDLYIDYLEQLLQKVSEKEYCECKFPSTTSKDTFTRCNRCYKDVNKFNYKTKTD